uniref:Uncharacterized protein n=1 Tax=Podarcis muralis TaxID=64176 RepID=A0A670JUZ4_PODMU
SPIFGPLSLSGGSIIMAAVMSLGKIAENGTAPSQNAKSPPKPLAPNWTGRRNQEKKDDN